MPRRARIAFLAAGGGIALLALTWLLSHDVAVVRRADVAILAGFADLGRPRVDAIANRIAGLCDPGTYVYLAAIPIIVALARRRFRVALMIAVVLLAANATTELLKPLLAAPRDEIASAPVISASWPSGHATAAMALALCAVIAAPPRWRPLTAAAMAGFAVAVSYSFLELGWHYPSDVLGGFLVAGVWTLLGVAGLSIVRSRSGAADAPRATEGRVLWPRTAPGWPPLALAAVVAAAGLAVVTLVRPRAVAEYAAAHPAFVLGAAAIAAAGELLAAGLALVLRRT